MQSVSRGTGLLGPSLPASHGTVGGPETHRSLAGAGFAPARAGHKPVVQILGLILIGLVIGVLARLVLPGRQRIGMGLTLLLGVGGALIGGIVASAIGTGDIFELNIIGTIVGVIAAAGLIGAADAAGLGKGARREELSRGRR